MGTTERHVLPNRLAWAKHGQMPVPVVETDTGRYFVLEATPRAGRTVAYCRVLSADQQDDLERQAGRVVTAATARGLTVADVVTEVGSGLNARRPKLAKFRGPAATTVVVEHRERLARFVVEYLTCALAAAGRTVVVLHEAGVDDGLVRDMTEVLASCCARLDGCRSVKRRARAVMTAAGVAV